MNEAIQTATADVNGTKLFYRIAGDPQGPPVLPWHGFLEPIDRVLPYHLRHGSRPVKDRRPGRRRRPIFSKRDFRVYEDDNTGPPLIEPPILNLEREYILNINNAQP